MSIEWLGYGLLEHCSALCCVMTVCVAGQYGGSSIIFLYRSHVDDPSLLSLCASSSDILLVLQEGALTKTEAEMCDIHLLPPNEDPETCASWLRMRNRDGRYTLMFEEWVTEGDFIISPR